MHGDTRYRKCWTVFKIVFTLSHGQAAVEKGFSANKELLVENLQQLLISVRGSFVIASPIFQSPYLKFC